MHTVGEADKLLPALGCGSDDDQQALRGVFETGLHVNAVDPEVDIAFGREIALAPAGVFFGPSLLQASNSRGREPAGVKQLTLAWLRTRLKPRCAIAMLASLNQHDVAPRRSRERWQGNIKQGIMQNSFQ